MPQNSCSIELCHPPQTPTNKCCFRRAASPLYSSLPTRKSTANHSQIAENLHKSLDVETIWQLTANSLGQVLNASRCIICSYQKHSKNLESSSFLASENHPNYSAGARRITTVNCQRLLAPGFPSSNQKSPIENFKSSS